MIHARTRMEPRPGSLTGEMVALTGRLATMTRAQAEALVRAAGGAVAADVSQATTMLVVGARGWPLLESGRPTRKLAEAERLRASGRRLRIVAEHDFRSVAGLDPAPDEAPKPLDAPQVAAALGVDAAVIERWRQLGLVRAVDGRYDFRDLVSLRTVTQLVARGVSPVVIRRSLEGLSGVLPEVDRPLAQLSLLVSDAGSLVAELEGVLLAPGGQFELRFDGPARDRSAESEAPCAPAAHLDPDADDAERCIDAGVEHEEAGALADAERCYRRAIELDPAEPRAQLNLGNALLARGAVEAALERFSQAAALAPGWALAWFNLAHAQDGLGQPSAAVASLRRALDADPQLADAHFNLADLLDRLGERTQAESAWRAYLRLDPESDWAAEARRRLQGSRSPAWA